MRWCLHLVALFTATAAAQVPVHFVNDAQRFVVYANERFEHIEPRPPKQVIALEGRLVYIDHEGRLKVFLPEGRQLYLLEKGGVNELQGEGSSVAWLHGDTLKVLEHDHSRVVAVGVEQFKVSRELVVYQGKGMHQLHVFQQGEVTDLAFVPQAEGTLEWIQGMGTVVFRDEADSTVRLFQDGAITELSEAYSGAIHVAGDMVCYWHGAMQRYVARNGTTEKVISEAIPRSARVGDGIIAFEDADGRFQCYAQGVLHTVITEWPSTHWVEDSVLLYLNWGQLFVFHPGGSTLVEPYVPEQWQVYGNLLVYLDINREVRGLRGQERLRFGKEPAVEGFELFGDAVLYRSPFGLMTVIERGKAHVYEGIR